jgi:ankyrin repeat protein
MSIDPRVQRTLVTVLLTFVLLASGCAAPTSIGDYFGDRLHDLADVCNVEFGAGIGVYAELRVRRAVDLAVGYIEPATRWLGLLDGKFGAMSAGRACGLPYYQAYTLGATIVGVSDGDPIAPIYPVMFLLTSSEENAYIVSGKQRDRQVALFILAVDNGTPVVRWADVSAELSVGGRVRLTVSPGQALDLLGGLFFLDVAGDDDRESWRITTADDALRRFDLQQRLVDAVRGEDVKTIEHILDMAPELINESYGRVTSHDVVVGPDTLLSYAANRGSVRAAQALIRKGAKLDPFSAARLDMADEVARAISRTPEVAADLAQKGLLHVAAAKNAVGVIRLLLQHKVDVNQRCFGTKITPLHQAAYSGAEEAVEVLIKAGADLNAIDYDERTPLDLAVQGQKNKVAELLRKHGAKQKEARP